MEVKGLNADEVIKTEFVSDTRIGVARKRTTDQHLSL